MEMPIFVVAQGVDETRTKHFGMLWTILSLMGLNVFEETKKRRCIFVSRMIRKFGFPFLMTCSMVYVTYHLIIRIKLIDYESALDISLAVLPNLMWLLMNKRKSLLINLLSHLSKMTPQVVTDRSLNPRVMNFILVCAFVYPTFVSTVNLYRNGRNGTFNKGYIQTDEDIFFEYVQKAQKMIFPSILALTYTALCYIFVRHLRFYNSEFSKATDIRSSYDLKLLVEGYIEVVNGIQLFQDIFSSPAFLLMWQNFCVVSFLALEAMNKGSWMESLMLEAILFMSHACAIIGVVTVCAAEVPLLMQRIKLSLLNLSSRKLAQEGSAFGEKHVDIVIKMEATVLTACNVFPFDRGFLLKAIGAVVAQAVIFHQIIEK